MAKPVVASYGTWTSSITTDLIVAETIGLGEASIFGDHLYWVESRPQEQGRAVLAEDRGSPRDMENALRS